MDWAHLSEIGTLLFCKWSQIIIIDNPRSTIDHFSANFSLFFSLYKSMDMTMRVEHLVGLVVSNAARKDEMSHFQGTNTLYLFKAPTHFLWLLLCFLSHSYLNFCAELLRFGDRHFYGDWWSVALKNWWHWFFSSESTLCSWHCFFPQRNATTLFSFWTSWSIPYQKWCHRCYNTTVFELILNFGSFALKTRTMFHFWLCVPLLGYSHTDTYTAGWWKITWLRHMPSYWSSWCLLLCVRYSGK